MESPFPGMDPFLERPGVWAEFHDMLAVAARQQLLPQLPDGYDCRVEGELYLPSTGEAEFDRRLFGQSDFDTTFRFRAETSPAEATETEERVGLGGGSVRDLAGTGAALAAPVVARLPEVPEARPERSLTIRDRDGDRIVCVAEILSPTNKRPGRDRERYLRKRRAILWSDTHLVEVDLLRSGPPLPMESDPGGELRVAVSHAADRPEVGVWPFGLRDPLPTVPVPLGEDDPPLKLDLAAAVARAFAENGFFLRAYRRPPDPPLAPADAAWAADLLTAAGIPLPPGFPPTAEAAAS